MSDLPVIHDLHDSYLYQSRAMVSAQCAVCQALNAVHCQGARMNMRKNGGRYKCHGCRSIKLEPMPDLPDAREVRLKKLAEKARDPQYIENRAAAMKKLYENPDHRAKIARVNKETNARMWADPAWTEQEMKRRTDPNDAERRKEISKHATVTGVEKISASAKKSWQDPEYVDKITASMPARKAHLSKIQKKKWENPKFREHMAKVLAAAPSISTTQLTLYTVLETLGLPFVRESEETRAGYYVFDCAVLLPNGHKLMIEVQGMHWHQLPVARSRDKSKRTYLERYHKDCSLMYIWENEFWVPDLVPDRIKGVVEKVLQARYVQQLTEPQNYGSRLSIRRTNLIASGGRIRAST